MAKSENNECMDQWREYFASANVDIFETIARTITVAASDYPNEFKIIRDEIAKTLFSCKLIDHSKYYKCENSSFGDDNFCNVEPKENDYQSRTYIYREDKILFDEIEEETDMVGEVIRIKGIVDNNEDASQSELYNSLRKLQLMCLPARTLVATKIEESVDALQNYRSKDVSGMATILVREWKDTINGWMGDIENMVVTERNKESPSNNYCGLLCPPLDDFAFVYPQITLPELNLSSFFNDIDDNYNLENVGESNENLKMQTMEIDKVPDHDQQKRLKMLKKQSMVVKPNKPSNSVKYLERAKNMKKQQKTQVVEVRDLLRQWVRKGKRSSRCVHIHDLLRQWGGKGKRNSRYGHIACPTVLAIK